MTADDNRVSDFDFYWFFSQRVAANPLQTDGRRSEDKAPLVLCISRVATGKVREAGFEPASNPATGLGVGLAADFPSHKVLPN